jgi:hypothetical protein
MEDVERVDRDQYSLLHFTPPLWIGTDLQQQGNLKEWPLINPVPSLNPPFTNRSYVSFTK